MGTVRASTEDPTTGHVVGDGTFVDVELNSGSLGTSWKDTDTSNGEAPSNRKSSLIKGSSRLLRKKIVQKYGRNRLSSRFTPQRKYNEMIDENVSKTGKNIGSNDDTNTVSTQQNEDHYEESDDVYINPSTRSDDTMQGSTDTYSVNIPSFSFSNINERNGTWFPVLEPGSSGHHNNIGNPSVLSSNDYGRFTPHHVSWTFEIDDEEDADQYSCHGIKGRPHFTSFNCSSNCGHSSSDHLQEGKTTAAEKQKLPKTLMFEHDDEANIRWQRPCRSVTLFLALLGIALFAVATTAIHISRHQATKDQNITSSSAAKDAIIPEWEIKASTNSSEANEENSTAEERDKGMTESILLSVLESTSSFEILSDKSSLQWMAFSWLRNDSYALMALEQMASHLQRKGQVVSDYANSDTPPARMNDVNEVWLKGDNGSPSRTRAVDILLERYAMATLYLYTGGDDAGARGWKRSTNWLSHSHLCEWQGVMCTPELDPLRQLVTELNLADNFLAGELPPHELQALPRFLTKLDLGYNKIVGTVPSGIHQLKHLKELRLQSNSLTGEVPQSVCELQPFDIFSADCSGGDPQLICHCCTLCFHEQQ